VTSARLVGASQAQEIRARYPAVGVLVLSQYLELGLAEELLADSATNIFRKLGLAESSDDHRRVLAVLTFLNA
jgi:hypothetical protein